MENHEAMGQTREQWQATARRLVMEGPAASQATWERVQRVRCAHNAPHPQRLVIPKSGGKNETVLVDLGLCKHNTQGGR